MVFPPWCCSVDRRGPLSLDYSWTSSVRVRTRRDQGIDRDLQVAKMLEVPGYRGLLIHAETDEAPQRLGLAASFPKANFSMLLPLRPTSKRQIRLAFSGGTAVIPPARSRSLRTIRHRERQATRHTATSRLPPK